MTTQQLDMLARLANQSGHQSIPGLCLEAVDILQELVDAREEHDYETAMSRAEQLVGKWERT